MTSKQRRQDLFFIKHTISISLSDPFFSIINVESIYKVSCFYYIVLYCVTSFRLTLIRKLSCVVKISSADR